MQEERIEIPNSNCFILAKEVDGRWNLHMIEIRGKEEWLVDHNLIARSKIEAIKIFVKGYCEELCKPFTDYLELLEENLE